LACRQVPPERGSYFDVRCYGSPNTDEVAGYLCRLLYLLADFDQPFEHGTAVDLESLRLAFFSGLAIGRCNKARPAEHLYHDGLNRCRLTGLMRFDEVDRYRHGMRSGSGWTDIVFLTPAGYRHAFPETGDDWASTPQDANREQQAESVADPQMSGTNDAAGSGPVDINLQPQVGPELAAGPTAESQTLAADGDDDDQDATGGGDATTQNIYRELAKWAADNLKGKQRRMIELLAENNDKLPLADLNLACDWSNDGFNRCRQHVNKVLRKAGWLVERHDNEARLRQLEGRLDACKRLWPT